MITKSEIAINAIVEFGIFHFNEIHPTEHSINFKVNFSSEEFNKVWNYLRSEYEDDPIVEKEDNLIFIYVEVEGFMINFELS